MLDILVQGCCFAETKVGLICKGFSSDALVCRGLFGSGRFVQRGGHSLRGLVSRLWRILASSKITAKCQNTSHEQFEFIGHCLVPSGQPLETLLEVVLTHGFFEARIIAGPHTPISSVMHP